MKNNNITHSNILKLYTESVIENSFNELSPHKLGHWLKIQTNNNYVVMPRDIAVALIDNLKLTSGARSSEAIIKKWGFQEMNKWL